MPRWRVLALCIALGGCASGGPMLPVNAELFAPARDPEKASQCTLKRRAVVPLTDRGLVLVNARINGGSALLVLDTGAERSIITAAAAKRVGVTTRYDFAGSMRGIERSIQTGDARLESFVLGGATLEYPRILVGSVEIALRDGLRPDGLLGADLLDAFDLDLDLPHQQLTLYDRLVCDTLRPPWPGGYTTLETTRSLSRHPFFPVEVDGHSLTATLDTGAQRTAVGTRAASLAGLSAAALASDPVRGARGAAGEVIGAALHQFREFRIGADALRSPVLVAGIAMPRDVDAIVGLDFLASHRIWISYGSRRIFIAHG